MLGWVTMVPALLVLSAQEAAVPQPAHSPAMAEAIANKARVKTKPSFKDGPDAVLSEAAKAAGAHGSIQLSLIIDVEGKPAEVSVLTSSRSPELDAIAVEAVKASRYEPAKDKDGTPIALRVVTSSTFYNVHLVGRNDGMVQHQCAQFLRDENWWAAHWPGERSYTFNIALGATTITTRGSMSDAKALSKTVQDFTASFERAKERCAKAPDTLFVDALEPGGELLRKLAGSR